MIPDPNMAAADPADGREHRDLVLFSGGLDSTTALALSAHHGTATAAVSVHYGQRHHRETQSAAHLAYKLGVRWQLLDLTEWGNKLTGSALTDESVDLPQGHYDTANMATTVVPNRNATLLMAVAGLALPLGCNRVVTAVHSGDHALYADCRPEFIQSANRTAWLGTDGQVSIHAPFIHHTKTDIARLALDLLDTTVLRETWSCYDRGPTQCGRCATCLERHEALTAAGGDPTPYRNQEVWT